MKKNKKMYEVTRKYTYKATQWINKKTNQVYNTIKKQMKLGGNINNFKYTIGGL